MSEFSLIKEDFIDNLNSILFLIDNGNFRDGVPPEARIASSNASVLLMGATFEEFIRQMATAYASAKIKKASSVGHVPAGIFSFVWRAALEEKSKKKINIRKEYARAKSEIAEAKTLIENFECFLQGDTNRDIVGSYIRNENNMRPGEINRLFKISGKSDVCKKCCEDQRMMDFYGTLVTDTVHGRFVSDLERFYERRNDVAHALDPKSSVGDTILKNDLALMKIFATALNKTLELEF